MINSRQTVGSSPRSIRLSMSACTTAGFSVAPSTRPERMFVAVPIDAERGDKHQVVADVQPVDLDDEEVQLEQIRCHPFGQPLGGQRDEPARGRRLRGAVPGDDRQITLSGSRTARLSLRVDTLISIRFMAQRPSQSSACAAGQVGSATSWPPRLRTRGRCTATLPPWKPILPLVLPQR